MPDFVDLVKAALDTGVPDHGNEGFVGAVDQLTGAKLPPAADPAPVRLTFALAPVGVPLPWLGATAPPGTLPLDGREIAKKEFPLLWGICGDLWGTPVSADNFILPDWRERSPYGVGTKTEVNTVGKTDGAAVGSRGPSHTHTATLADHHHSFTPAGSVALAPDGAVLKSETPNTEGLTSSPTVPVGQGATAAFTGTPGTTGDATLTPAVSGTGPTNKGGFATCLWIVVAG